MPKHQQIQQSKKTHTIFQKQATPVIQTPLSNPYSIIQRAKINPKSLTHADVMQLQRTIGNQAVGRLLSSIGNTSTDQQMPVQRQEIPEEEEPLQGKMAETIQRQEISEEEEPLKGKFEHVIGSSEPVLRKVNPTTTVNGVPVNDEPLQGKFGEGMVQKAEKAANNTGLPDNLKAGVENLSGMSMDGVKVHYNSGTPAQLNALAYAQGSDIHVAPGQERHLPHEAWHVVQQKQGRVKPTMQMKEGTPVNDDEGLEREADMMGSKALQMMRSDQVAILSTSRTSPSLQWRKRSSSPFPIPVAVMSEAAIQQPASSTSAIVQRIPEPAVTKQDAGLHKSNRKAILSTNLVTPRKGRFSTKLKIPANSLIIVDYAGKVTNAQFSWATYGGREGYVKKKYIDKGEKIGNSTLYSFPGHFQYIYDEQTKAYITGATHDEIIKMLSVNNDAQIIHNYMTNVIPGFILGNIIFASVADGKVGSIYFNGGRVRLIHEAKPAVELSNEKPEQYTISYEDNAKLNTGFNNGTLVWPGNRRDKVKVYEFVRKLGSCHVAVADQGDILVEFWGVEGDRGNHTSRGGPKKFGYDLKQYHLNIIGNVAKEHSNKTLRLWMEAIPALKTIPIQ